MFSDLLFDQESIKSPYLVLDEVTALKNSNSVTFAAILALRSISDTCIMLTGSPVDNTWMDIYAYIQRMSNQMIDHKSLMRDTFATYDDKGQLRPPKGQTLRRLIQLLDSFVICR